MPKASTNIYKRKDGRWEARYIKGYKEDGRIAYGYLYGKTLVEAKEKLKGSAALSPPGITARKDIMFCEMARLWLSSIALRVKMSTYMRYMEALERHILPSLGGVKMRMLTSDKLEQFAKNKLQNGRSDGTGGLAPKTVRDLLSTIKSIMDYAKRYGYVMDGIIIPYPKNNQQEMRVLTKKEQLMLEALLVDRMDLYKLAVLVCLYTGLRLGEVCALKWQDIAENTIYVRKTLQRIKNTKAGGKKTVTVIDSPKSRSSLRQIPVPSFLVRHLQRYRQDDEVFLVSGMEARPAEMRTLQNHFQRHMQEAELPPANFHALRHTFATRCIEAGVDTKSLSEMLGHANVNITLSRYVHSSMNQKRESLNKLVQYMNA